MARRLAAVPEKPAHPKPPDLRSAVDQAVASMAWKADTDGAMVALAQRLAAEIEQAIDRAEELSELYREAGGDMSVIKRLQRLEAMCDVTKTVGWLGPQLQGVLKELGGSPQARKAMQTSAPVGGALASLRSSLPSAGKDNSKAVDSSTN